MSSKENSKRAQSTSCLPNGRVSLSSVNIHQPPKIYAAHRPQNTKENSLVNVNNNNLSVSVGNLHKNEEEKKNSKNQVKTILNNYERSLIKVKPPEIHINNKQQRTEKAKEQQTPTDDLNDVNMRRMTVVNSFSTNSNKKIFEILTRRRNSDEPTEINNSTDENSQNNSLTSSKPNKQIRHLQQIENSTESELDRVFKVNSSISKFRKMFF